MKRAFAFGVLGVVVASTVVGAIACSSDSGGGPTGTTDTGGVKIDTAVPGDGGFDTAVPGDGSGTDTNVTPTDSTTTDGGPVLPPACPATLKDGTVAEFQDPASAKKAVLNDGLHLTGAVATSGKFLVSKSKGGTCLYGVFVADANATFAPYSGILVVSRGTNAVTGETGTTTFCTNGDLIPTDVKPGDLLELKGTFDQFGPTSATCGAATPPVSPPDPPKGNQLTQLCAYTKTGTGTAPTPATVVPDDLKGGANVAKWMGGLVKVTGVKTKTAIDGFGNFTLDPSGLQVGDTIYYRGAATTPVVPAGKDLTEIVGMGYLDFCSWSLEPRSACDIKPTPNVGPDGGTAPTCP